MNLPKMELMEGRARPFPLSRAALLDALFARALADCRRAVEGIEAGDVAGKSEAIRHALDIVETLGLALDYSVAPELCAQLETLYVYVEDCLVAGNRHVDATQVRRAMGVLKVLRDAFAEAARDLSSTGQDQQGQP